MKPLPRFLILSVCAALALIGLVPNVFAGAMFRCRAPDGTTAITNRPEGYVACTKVPHSDYAEPAQAAAHKAAVKPGPPVPVAAAALSSDSKAASATAHAATEPAPTEPVQRQQARSAYKSMPPSAFADVVSETRLNGGAPSRSDANVVERPDKLTQVRRGAVYKVARANGVIE